MVEFCCFKLLSKFEVCFAHYLVENKIWPDPRHVLCNAKPSSGVWTTLPGIMHLYEYRSQQKRTLSTVMKVLEIISVGFTVTDHLIKIFSICQILEENNSTMRQFMSYSYTSESPMVQL
jgi:hypothetical protein